MLACPGPRDLPPGGAACKTGAVTPEDWDWEKHVVDHLDLRASDYETSVRFYTTVLAPLGIPAWPSGDDGERAMCFTRVNVVDRTPPTTGLHLCFAAASRDEVEAFHRAGIEAASHPTERPATATMPPATRRHSSSTRTATTLRPSIAT
jgi:hypothetical protein